MPFRKIFRSSLFWFGMFGLLVLGNGIGFTAWQWDWLHGNNPSTTTSTTLRNMGLLIGGGIAAVFAIWRGWVAERQSATARRQVDIADRNLLYERYQRGAEMLGSEVLGVRMAGIYSLQRLAEENPEQYHIQVMQLLCSFVRNPVGDQESPVRTLLTKETIPRLREDIQAVLDVIGSRSQTGIAIERVTKSFSLDFRDAHLAGARLNAHNFSGGIFSGVDLSWASLKSTKLDFAILSNAHLSHADLRNGHFSFAFLDFSSLTNCDFDGADLSRTNAFCSDLSDSSFSRASLSGAFLSRSKMQGCILMDANLTSTNFSVRDASNALETVLEDYKDHGLTQAQLDDACCEPSRPPNLNGLLDAQTREPLIWRGGSCSE